MENLRSIYRNIGTGVNELRRSITAKNVGSLGEFVRQADTYRATAFTVEPITDVEMDCGFDTGFGRTTSMPIAYDHYIRYSAEGDKRRVVYREYLGSDRAYDYDRMGHQARERSEMRRLLTAVLRGQTMTTLVSPNSQVVVKESKGILDDKGKEYLLTMAKVKLLRPY